MPFGPSSVRLPLDFQVARYTRRNTNSNRDCPQHLLELWVFSQDRGITFWEVGKTYANGLKKRLVNFFYQIIPILKYNERVENLTTKVYIIAYYS